MRSLPRRSALLILYAALAATSAYAQTPTVLGYWREPGGALIRIVPCDHGLCVEIAKLSAGNHLVNDARNPDPKLRNRPLCGLRIGEGFVQVDAKHARGGHLYDPRSGRTYSGEMTELGNLLRLRGYVGLPIFGRTATWVRASQPANCTGTIARSRGLRNQSPTQTNPAKANAKQMSKGGV